MGAISGLNRRQRKRSSMYDICEVFSPARVVKIASLQGLKGGWSLDVATTCAVTGRKWDCQKSEDREWCRRMLHRDKPQMLLVSHPCTLFSQLQFLSPNGLPSIRCPKEWREAIIMVEFAVELCQIQRRAGRAFVFEHPRAATSWESVKGLKELLNTPGVHESVLDICQFGMHSIDEHGEVLVRKTIRLLTNSEGCGGDGVSLHGWPPSRTFDVRKGKGSGDISDGALRCLG